MSVIEWQCTLSLDVRDMKLKYIETISKTSGHPDCPTSKSHNVVHVRLANRQDITIEAWWRCLDCGLEFGYLDRGSVVLISKPLEALGRRLSGPPSGPLIRASAGETRHGLSYGVVGPPSPLSGFHLTPATKNKEKIYEQSPRSF
ncbi:hypothetical protein LCGC14_0848750 [marine sediment metagenome]|uniref:Uncharacterized protein n=1 Tax=marine sediment metagenome TaxID=412755 RepID=A0A0F9SI09_9ZZZZ